MKEKKKRRIAGSKSRTTRTATQHLKSNFLLGPIKPAPVLSFVPKVPASQCSTECFCPTIDKLVDMSIGTHSDR